MSVGQVGQRPSVLSIGSQRPYLGNQRVRGAGGKLGDRESEDRKASGSGRPSEKEKQITFEKSYAKPGRR